MRAFDLLSRAEFEIRASSQPRHQFEMALVKWIHLGSSRRSRSSSRDCGQSGTGLKVDAGLRRRHAGTARAPAPATPGPRPRARARPRRHGSSDASAQVSAGARRPDSSKLRSRSFASRRSRRRNRRQVRAAVVHPRTEQGVLRHGRRAGAEDRGRGRSRSCFTFAPVHKALKAQLEGKRALDRAARAGGRADGRCRSSRVRPRRRRRRRPTCRDPAAARRADLRARAKAEPAVQAVLDVFGGEIEDVEEI